MARSTFSFRALVTTILVWSFAALLVSGIVLYVAPPGRVAHWSGWRLLGLTKPGWQAVHTLTALLFIVGGLFHLLKFNWAAFKAYLRRSREAAAPFRWPVVLGTLLFSVTLAGTIAGLPPFSTVMDLGEQATNAWATQENEPPVPHMELRTLGQLASERGVSVSRLQSILKAAGLHHVAADRTLREIARANGTTPAALWKTLEARGEGAGGSGRGSIGQGIAGGGWGRLTVAQAAARAGIDPNTAVENLRAAGIDAKPEERLRTVAERIGRTSQELLLAMSGR